MSKLADAFSHALPYQIVHYALAVGGIAVAAYTSTGEGRAAEKKCLAQECTPAEYRAAWENTDIRGKFGYGAVAGSLLALSLAESMKLKRLKNEKMQDLFRG
jgi:hypothetical protein